MLELVLSYFEKGIPYMLINSRLTDRESSAENVGKLFALLIYNSH